MSTEQQQDEGLVGQASAKVQDVASTAQDKAEELTEKGRGRLSRQLDRRTTDAGTQARSAAQALRQSTAQLRSEGSGQIADLAEQAADRLERLSSYLERHDGDDLIRDVEGFARRRPWAIAGIGLLAGLAAARFVKASSEQRYQGVDSGYRPYSRPATTIGGAERAYGSYAGGAAGGA